MNKFICCFLILCYGCIENINRCERHYVYSDFSGKVTIYYSQEKGLSEIDSIGCFDFNIKEDGNYCSKHPFNEINRYNSNEFRCYERDSFGVVKEIPVFTKESYLLDSANNNFRKYIYLSKSGYKNIDGSKPLYYSEYYIDFGYNWKHY